MDEQGSKPFLGMLNKLTREITTKQEQCSLYKKEKKKEKKEKLIMKTFFFTS